MSVQVENLEKNMAKLTIEVEPEKLEKAIQAAYQKQKGKISLPGFRKGKVPRSMIEKMYGVEIFYEDAANALINQEYPGAMKESGLEIVSRPDIEVTQIEKGKPFIFTAEVAVKPEVTLGKYKGVQVTKIDTSVSEEEVEEELSRERESNARTVTVEDRPVAEGDTAVIDFEGFVNGAPFEGGQGENHSLVIGSHSFIDTFEEQLIGRNAGDELEVSVTFPEEYHAQELAGKPAVFQVKINEIKCKELPELDDEFAQDISEFETLDEYKESLRDRLARRKEMAAKHDRQEEAIAKIIEKSEMEIPDAMLDTQVDGMIDQFANQITMQGMPVEQYMQYTGTSYEKMQEEMRPEALKQIQTRLVLEQIVKEEKIEVSEDEVNAEFERMAGMYGMKAEQAKGFMGGDDAVRKDLAVQKALDFVLDNVKEKAKPKGKEAEE